MRGVMLRQREDRRNGELVLVKREIGDLLYWLKYCWM